MGRYVVTAGYVTMETAVPGGRAAIDIPRGTILPDDVPAETVARALERGDIERLPVFAPPPVEPEPDSDEMPDGPIPAVLAWVGDDRDRAQHALDVEAAKGDAARKGIIDPLTVLLADGGEQ